MPASTIYYSSVPIPDAGDAMEVWTQETQWYKFDIYDEITDRVKTAIIWVADSTHTKETTVYNTAYKRIKILDRETSLPIFIGRVELVEPLYDQDIGGQALKITCKDYLQELAERVVSGTYDSHTHRSDLIGDILDAHVYTSQWTRDVEQSNQAFTLKKDYTGSIDSVLEAVNDISADDPWDAVVTGYGYDFNVHENPGATDVLTAVWRWDNSLGIWNDNTAEAEDSGGVPFEFNQDAANDYFYFGFSKPFYGLAFNITTLGAYPWANQVWQFWNGAWAAMVPRRSGNTFAIANEIQYWNVITTWNWASRTLVGVHAAAPPDTTSRYWIRFRADVITTTAWMDQIKIRPIQIFNYWRRHMATSGKVGEEDVASTNPSADGLIVEYGATANDYTLPITADYKFPRLSKDIITRVTTRYTDRDGTDQTATVTDAALEATLKFRKERIVNRSDITNSTDATNAATALRKQFAYSGMIQRGSVEIEKWPSYSRDGGTTWYIVRAGHEVRAKCSDRGIDSDMVVLSIDYREPPGRARLELVDATTGRGYAVLDSVSAINESNKLIAKTGTYSHGVPYRGIGFERYHYDGLFWQTFFESIDGFSDDSVFPGVLVLGIAYLAFDTGAAVADVAGISETVQYDIVPFTWNNGRRFKTRVWVESNTTQVFWIVTGDIGGGGINEHIGFKIVNGTLWGTTGDGGAESTVNLGATTAPDTISLEAVMDLSLTTPEVRFYVDGSYVNNLTANLPSGTTFATCVLRMYLQATGGAIRRARCSHWMIIQEP